MKLTIRTDGGARGNPGPAGAGVVIRDEQGKKLFAGGFYLGRMTNNLAEYHAILMALDLANQIGGTEIALFSDSELIVRQINGQYRVKNENLKPLYQQVQDHIQRFQSVVVTHVYREENIDADSLVNQAVSAQANVGGFIDPPPSSLSCDMKETSGPAANVPFQFADLDSHIAYQDRDAYRKIIGTSDDFASILICLNPHQRYPLRSPQASAAAIVITGSGTVKINDQKKQLKPNTWIQWSKLERIDFAAADEPLVIFITQVQSPSANN